MPKVSRSKRVRVQNKSGFKGRMMKHSKRPQARLKRTIEIAQKELNSLNKGSSDR